MTMTLIERGGEAAAHGAAPWDRDLGAASAAAQCQQPSPHPGTLRG